MLEAVDIARLISSRELSATDVLEDCLGRIEQINPRLNAIVTLDAARARARAREADIATGRGESWGPLHGVPFTLKDSHTTAGVRTTVGHPSLESHVPDSDGTVAARLRAAGAILVGKTNVPPFLMSAQTENAVFGRTVNPWNVERTCGGSSGGAVAAVASGLVPFDVGSDMSGSIRFPASYCGVYGLKPTAHRVPITGHIPPPPGVPRLDRMLGAVGPIARSAEDLGLVMSVLVGADWRDVESPPSAWRQEAAPDVRKLRIAYLPVFEGVPTSASVTRTVERVARALADAGAHVECRDPGFSKASLDQVWRECFALFGPVFAELTGAGLPVAAPDGPRPALADWVRALDRRDALIVAIDDVLREFDAFLCPAAISTAPPVAPPRSPIPVDGELVDSRFVDHYSYAFNLTGSPALTVPAAVADDGLPVGVQLVGRRFGDEHLIAVASTLAGVIGGFRAPPAVA